MHSFVTQLQQMFSFKSFSAEWYNFEIFTMHLSKRKTRTILFPHSYVSGNIPILDVSTHASAYAYFHFYKRHWALNEYAYPLSSIFEFPGSVLKVCQKHERKYVKCRYIESKFISIGSRVSVIRSRDSKLNEGKALIIK